MAKKSRHKTKHITITGVSELLQKLDKADNMIETALMNGLKKGTVPMKTDMQTFISMHHYSGLTENAFVEEFSIKDNKVFARVGYSVRKGGIAAIFLNVGTPRMAPSFFIDKTIDTNNGYLNQCLIDEVTKLLED